MATGLRHWLRSRLVKTAAQLEYRWGRSFRGRAIRRLWDDMAQHIHATWGRGRWDFPVLAGLIERHGVRSVLDIGCGSGRLFPLYLESGVTDVVGTDISGEALALARRDFPQIPTIHCRLEDLSLPDHRFDLTVSNRVLQHVPPDAIDAVIGNLCRMSRAVYLNEQLAGDAQPETFYMRKHPYPELFARRGWRVLESGPLEDQTWLLFGPTG